MAISLDKQDRLMLEKLQADATLGLDVLADACGLSIASVQRRLKRLRENKIILREIAGLDQDALEMEMSFVVMVELERERLDQLDAFRRAARAEPQVQQCYYITGEADFALICTARNMADFEALTHRLFFENTNVRRFRTSVVMDRAKVGLSVAIKDE
ncbi:Lrp/AsnC family transcriptional regulator [Undibacterium terreum]|uniref:ArsR family transcriptional regulator n=1 Tax=Undibacterium terreum TaxID=1224302 RepID=A0A916XPC1_9BURK|nr:Lrp/AsnC family transcriptional regulator [Undibacterium terreum]GGC89071.1 ArsR family transcriptional regulator [Undibacterium terreum]